MSKDIGKKRNTIALVALQEAMQSLGWTGWERVEVTKVNIGVLFAYLVVKGKKELAVSIREAQCVVEYFQDKLPETWDISKPIWGITLKVEKPNK